MQVGADLLAALRNKSSEQLLIDILDPSREVDPRYLSYQVTTRRGQLTVANRSGIEQIAGSFYGTPEAELRRLLGDKEMAR